MKWLHTFHFSRDPGMYMYKYIEDIWIPQKQRSLKCLKILKFYQTGQVIKCSDTLSSMEITCIII